VGIINHNKSRTISPAFIILSKNLEKPLNSDKFCINQGKIA
jgi:hypothetical protein